MTDHPVLIPTSLGPVGGIVSEPAGDPRAALILLQGGGRSGRSGFNAEWTLLARRLAEIGAVVLRVDYWHEGDSSMITADSYPDGRGRHGGVDRDLALLREVAAWFHERTERDLQLIGSCYGGRLAIELAGGYAEIAGMLLIVPYIRSDDEANRQPWNERMRKTRGGEQVEALDDERADAALVDPVVVDATRTSLVRGPTWALTGELDPGELHALDRLMGGCENGFELEVVADAVLYPGNDPDIQEIVSDRVAARLTRMLATTPAEQPSTLS